MSRCRVELLFFYLFVINVGIYIISNPLFSTPCLFYFIIYWLFAPSSVINCIVSYKYYTYICRIPVLFAETLLCFIGQCITANVKLNVDLFVEKTINIYTYCVHTKKTASSLVGADDMNISELECLTSDWIWMAGGNVGGSEGATVWNLVLTRHQRINLEDRRANWTDGMMIPTAGSRWLLQVTHTLRAKE